MTRFVVVTGTGTGVGKTVTTAALACTAEAGGSRVSVVKPYQTGVTGDEPSDVATVTALSGCTDVHELVRLDDALAPESAARLRGVDIPSVEDVVNDVIARGVDRDLTLVEGAGGVAVRLDPAGGTIATLAAALRDAGHEVEVLVVTSLGLGTLNHTELTVDALRRLGRVGVRRPRVDGLPTERGAGGRVRGARWRELREPHRPRRARVRCRR